MIARHVRILMAKCYVPDLCAASLPARPCSSLLPVLKLCVRPRPDPRRCDLLRQLHNTEGRHHQRTICHDLLTVSDATGTPPSTWTLQTITRESMMSPQESASCISAADASLARLQVQGKFLGDQQLANALAVSQPAVDLVEPPGACCLQSRR